MNEEIQISTCRRGLGGFGDIHVMICNDMYFYEMNMGWYIILQSLLVGGGWGVYS